MGASKAHFAEAEPISRFTKDVSKIINKMVTPPGSASHLIKLAPFKASKAPKFEWLKEEINKEAKKAMTI